MTSVKHSLNGTAERLQDEMMDQADDTSEVEPWQQLPDEPSKAHYAFSFYLYAGPNRSLKSVASALGKDKSYEKQLQKWSSMYNWVARASGWDFYIHKLLERQYIEDTLQMFDRHVHQARECQEKVFERLMSLDVATLKPSELIRLYDITVKIERNSLTLKSEFVNNKKKAYSSSATRLEDLL